MKNLLVSVLVGLALVGLVGCDQAPTTLTEDPTAQENKLAQSTADKANKALDYINEYINAYQEYGEARQNGTKSNATSGLTAEELMDIPYGSLFGQENYITISDNILNHENIEIEMTSDDYDQYDEDKLMQINSDLDKIILLASNETVFDASELTKETVDEKPQQKQEQPQVEENLFEASGDPLYESVMDRIRISTDDAQYYPPQMRDAYKKGDFGLVKQYCKAFLENTDGIIGQYQLPGGVYSSLEELRTAYETLDVLVTDGYKFEVGIYGWIDIINEETNNLINALY
ncbi:hypothetical protein GNF80_09420 [Clostridium perfringens]|nr:hypothetical protein [Clostridium perfringens]